MTFTRLTNSLKNALGIVALAVTTQSALAADWQINPAGGGVAGASSVSTIKVGGDGFVQILPDSNNSGAFTFIEYGAYRALNADGSAPFGASDLTVTYSVSGTGNFYDPSALRLNSGSINLFSDPNFDFATSTGSYGADNGNLVASFSVFAGYVANSSGLVAVKASGVAGSFTQGYLFDSNGTDLALLPAVLLELNIFNQPNMPGSLQVTEIACGMAGYAGPGCDGSSFVPSPLAYTVQDAGSVSISAVPEPDAAALLLAGLGLVALVARSRRKLSR